MIKINYQVSLLQLFFLIINNKTPNIIILYKYADSM